MSYRLHTTLGGKETSADDIMEWESTTGAWKRLGRMKHARHYHSISIVNLDGDIMIYNLNEMFE